MRRHSQVKTPWRLFFVFWNKRSVEFLRKLFSIVGSFFGLFFLRNIWLVWTVQVLRDRALGRDAEPGQTFGSFQRTCTAWLDG